MPKEPIRCFEGNAKPHTPFWNWVVVDSADEQEPILELDGPISEYSWWGDEITPKMFKDDLAKYGKGGPITVRISSPGGDVIAAAKMNTMIKEYPGKVTVMIDGMAASAATVVAVAGDVVKMHETAYFMIHDPLVSFFMAMLNISDLEGMAETLKAIKEGIVNAYETRTGLSRNRLSNLMTDETWMDANKARDLNFIDEIIKGEKKKLTLPENAAVVNALHRYANVPEALLRREPGQPEPESPDVTRLRAQVNLLKE